MCCISVKVTTRPASLALAVSLTPGMRLTLITPEGYGLQQDILEASQRLAASACRPLVCQHHRIDLLPSDVDAVYTTRWQTMGVPKPAPDWLTTFAPYQITPEIMARTSKSSRTIFLHDLPAIRGQEVVNEVLDGPQSVAFRQARHKLSGALSVLAWCHHHRLITPKANANRLLNTITHEGGRWMSYC